MPLPACAEPCAGTSALGHSAIFPVLAKHRPEVTNLVVQVDLTFYFIYRILELGSRTTLLALFTVSNMLAALLPAESLLCYTSAAKGSGCSREPSGGSAQLCHRGSSVKG